MDVIIHTQVYNGEKTLRRTIESVLAQTYREFIYHISDNASTDGTAGIIAEYAKQDTRIIPTFNATNRFYAYIDIVRKHSREYPEGYWAMLDADDEYVPEFLETMLAFIQENSLDLAACGFTAIDEETKRIIGHRQLFEDMILTTTRFCEHFCKYHTFMRNVCAKLFSLKLLSECTFETIGSMPSYGGDTIFATEAFGIAKRAGILGKTLHNVYYLTSSISCKWEPNRADSTYIRDDFTRGFLIKKCGSISEKNENFLHGVYFGSVTEMLPVLLNPELDMHFFERVGYLLGILKHEKTQQLLRIYANQNNLNTELRTPVCNWLLSHEQCNQLDGASSAVEVLAAMYPRLPDLADKNALAQMIIESPEAVRQILVEYGNLGL